MIEQIGRRIGKGAPVAAYQMLTHFKDQSWSAMNSFVHAGIHPLQRISDGFPLASATQVLRNSNGLCTVTGMATAILIGEEATTKSVSAIQSVFADCLPDLLVRSQATP